MKRTPEEYAEEYARAIGLELTPTIRQHFTNAFARLPEEKIIRTIRGARADMRLRETALQENWSEERWADVIESEAAWGDDDPTPNSE